MPQPLPRAAIGLYAHSGWAALVAVAGSLDKPVVIARRRITTHDPTIRGSKQPFHAAEPLDFPDAKASIDHCTSSTRKLSREALKAAIDGLRDKRYQAACCGIVLGSGRTLPELKKILASHALIHTAEGEFYRNALLEAASHCGLPVHGVKEKELLAQAAEQFHIKPDKLENRLTEVGKPLGAPWTRDQKYAALTGWMALAR